MLKLIICKMAICTDFLQFGKRSTVSRAPTSPKHEFHTIYCWDQNLQFWLFCFFTEAVFEKRCWEPYIINETNHHNTAGGVRVDMSNVNSKNDCEMFCEAVGINFSALVQQWLYLQHAGTCDGTVLMEV